MQTQADYDVRREYADWCAAEFAPDHAALDVEPDGRYPWYVADADREAMCGLCPVELLAWRAAREAHKSLKANLPKHGTSGAHVAWSYDAAFPPALAASRRRLEAAYDALRSVWLDCQPVECVSCEEESFELSL